jgi:ABC-type uncharacterized transport system ATPase subunit
MHLERSSRKARSNGDSPAVKAKPQELIIEMRGITKHFPGVVANDHIDFDLRACEIHALLGENGSGKTTLMNVLYGLYRPDEGEIRFRNQPVALRSPKDAIDLGIGMVHQQFMLVPPMSVTENIVLGLKSPREPLLDIGQAEGQIADLSKTYKLKVDPKAKVEQLSVGERQRVEIIKALYRGAKVLILDEPTSVLTPQETEDLFKALRSMAEEGLAIIFITHKLPEVMAISDRVTVLRRGKVVATITTQETNPTDLSRKMIGKDVLLSVEKGKAEKGKVVLEVKNLWALTEEGVPALKNISFSIHEGEILGVAGVAGNGQAELAQVLTGMRKATDGKVYISGKDMTNRSPKEIIEQGLGDIPEDRLGTGLILDFSIAENLIVEIRSKPPFSHRWFLPFDNRYFLDMRQVRQHAKRLIHEYGVDTTSEDAPARNLSGGNLQRVLLAKVLSRNPILLLAAQPTSGLDIGAAVFIRNKLMEQRDRGAAILLVSEDLDEILTLSDRIAVMYGGEIVGIVPTSQTNVKEIGLMMTGAK